MKYILLDLERTVGTGVVHYWKRNNRGYTTKPGEAGYYNAQDAAAAECDVNGNTITVDEDKFKKVMRKYGEIL